ncbi:hypothetical protein HC864_01855 [Candidatus Gracilibacteria bacterium]|nr:hypothetical protein [Candidatus Gracilibacteria bacterium]
MVNNLPNVTNCTSYFVLGTLKQSSTQCNCVSEALERWSLLTGENFGNQFDPGVSPFNQTLAGGFIPINLTNFLAIYNVDGINPLTGGVSSPNIWFDRVYWANR